MNDPSKAIEELIEQNTALKRRVQELERFEVLCREVEAELQCDNAGKPCAVCGISVDISEHKRIENALRENQDRLNDAQRIAHIGNWDLDLLTGRLIWSNEIYRIFEIDPNTFGASYDAFLGAIHPDDRDAVNRAYTDSLESRKPYGISHRLQMSDGRIKYVQEQCETFFTAEGRPLRSIGTVQDITERKQAEYALLESEQKYRTLIEQMPDMVWHKDINSKYLSCNSNYAKVLGVPLESIYGRTDDDFYKAELAVKYQTDDKSVVMTGQPLEMDERWEESGEIRWLHTSKVPLFNKDGNITGTIGIGRDITERKLAEDALKKSEERHRAILKTALDGFWLVDASTGRLIEVNDAASAMLGYTSEELLARGLQDIDAQWSHEEIDCEMQKVKTAGKAFFETRHRTRSGQIIDVEISVNYLAGNDQFFSFIRNITERKRAEEELKNALLFNKHIIDSAQDGIIVYDSDLHYQLWNKSMEKLTGLNASDLIGKTPMELFPFLVENGVVEDLNKILRGEEVQPREFQDHIPESGRSGWVFQTSAPLLDATGKIIGILAVVRDITEQKRTTEQLHQAQKMEAIGQLAGGVAHDFNNMLTVIGGYSNLGLMAAESSSEFSHYFEEILKTSERSANLTHQLLAFARKQIILPQVMNLNETVSSMLKMLQRLIGEDIRLTSQTEAKLWQIKMDPSQIDQILANLCVNARDAINGTGCISIETHNRTIDEYYCHEHPDALPGEYVTLSVSDNGCGMERETLIHIFEPFYTTKEAGKGTGLGLATVFGIVKQNNGFVNVYSEPGQGTTFSIYIPRLLDSDLSPSTETALADLQRGHETILLVEDEPAILQLTFMMLEKHGYNVLKAETPGEAIRLAQNHAGVIDLVMTDVIMPEMNGRDLSNRLLSIYPEIKRIFMSGYTADIIAAHGVLEEGVHFIQKPFTLPVLITNVREVLDSGCYT